MHSDKCVTDIPWRAALRALRACSWAFFAFPLNGFFRWPVMLRKERRVKREIGTRLPVGTKNTMTLLRQPELNKIHAPKWLGYFLLLILSHERVFFLFGKRTKVIPFYCFFSFTFFNAYQPCPLTCLSRFILSIQRTLPRRLMELLSL